MRTHPMHTVRAAELLRWYSQFLPSAPDLPGEDIRVWGEFTDRPMESLAQLLRDLGAAEGRIGIEFAYLPAGDHEQLKALLPKARLEPADALFETPEQIWEYAETILPPRRKKPAME